MPETPSPVTIPNDLLQAVYREARKSYPNEACGWLTGSAAHNNRAVAIRACVNAKSLGVHSAVPDRGAETAYEFTAQDAIDLDRSFDTDTPAVVIYHSHPNGQAYFSRTGPSVCQVYVGRWARLPCSAACGGHRRFPRCGSGPLCLVLGSQRLCRGIKALKGCRLAFPFISNLYTILCKSTPRWLIEAVPVRDYPR